MAKNDNLTDFIRDLAEGIMIKKGITTPLNPQDFRAEIESISSGTTPTPPSGGSSSGTEETYTYYKAPEGGISLLGDLIGTSLIKLNSGGIIKCVTTLASSFAAGDWTNKAVEAVAVSSKSPIFKMVANMEGAKLTVNSLDEYAQIGGLGEKYPYVWASWEQITEKEFYNLD